MSFPITHPGPLPVEAQAINDAQPSVAHSGPAQIPPSEQAVTGAPRGAPSRDEAVQGRARFFTLSGMINAASHPLETVGYQARLATKLIDRAGLPPILSSLEKASGLPISTLSHAAARAARVPLHLLTQWEPKPGIPNDAALDILEHIADELDPRTLNSFSQASRAFRRIAGGATQELTFRGTDDLHRRSEAGLARFGERGLACLSLTHGQFGRRELELIPASLRDSIRSLHLESPLADDAWPLLAGFANLREVQVASVGGMEAADLACLPTHLQKIHVKMPMTSEAMAQLDRFPDLREIGVAVRSGAQFEQVLAELTGTAPLAEDGIRHPLADVAITGLTVEHDVSGGNLTAGALPEAIKNWLMAQPLVSLDLPLKGPDLGLMLTHPTLRELRCGGAGMSTADALKIAASPRLEKVELPWNRQIGDQGIRALLDNRRIHTLNIGACGGSDALILSLHRSCPSHLKQLTLSA